jgi:hypothetical protein
MTRNGKCVLSGVLAVLALGIGAMPVSAQQSANGSSPTGGCGVLAYDAHELFNRVTGTGSVLAGSVTVNLPCDGPAFASLTTVILTTASTGVSAILRASCIAPAVPGGCTPGSPAVVPVPDNPILVSPFNGNALFETRTAAVIFPSLTRGHYQFDANLLNFIAGDLTVEKRVFTVQTGGALPVTPPGSSQ